MPGPAVRRTGHAPGADRVELAIGEHVLGAARSVQLLVRLEGELPVGAEPGPGPVQVDPAGLLHQDRPGPVVLSQRAQRLGLLLAAAVLAAAPGRHPHMFQVATVTRGPSDPPAPISDCAPCRTAGTIPSSSAAAAAPTTTRRRCRGRGTGALAQLGGTTPPSAER
ncbi:hypothetical protein ACI1MP_06860 [Kitasatospora griseola]|uniref:hypothetical protein n=1 Tax=Kitasatospora griseola TaxID=2064 RepID=UPI003855DA47